MDRSARMYLGGYARACAVALGHLAGAVSDAEPVRSLDPLGGQRAAGRAMAFHRGGSGGDSRTWAGEKGGGRMCGEARARECGQADIGDGIGTWVVPWCFGTGAARYRRSEAGHRHGAAGVAGGQDRAPEQSPAKYDAASGAGIIIIRTKKLKEKGWNMQGSAVYAQAYYGRTNESLAGNYHRGKLNAYGNFSYAHQDSHRQVDIDREYFYPNGMPQSFFSEVATVSPARVSPTAKAGLDYYLTSGTTVGVMWMGVFSTLDKHSPERTTIDAASGALDSFKDETRA